MRSALLGCQEPRSNPDTVRASRKSARHLLAGADSAGSHNGDVDRAFEFRKEVKQPDRASDVSSSLDPLGHDEVAAGSLGSNGFGSRADLPARQRIAVMGDRDQGGVRLAVKELDDPR